MSSTTTLRAYQKPGRECCSVVQCSRPKYARGICVMHYTRLRRDGHVGSTLSQKRDYGSGHINEYGYLVVRGGGHPLATSQDKLLAHRGVLFDAIGPGPHPCHWCSRLLPWQADTAANCINVDHLDFNKLNNSRENLVPSCLDCNTKRNPS
ncbi:hypothetical protein [Pseudarthrobacter sp. LMD1-1-1.1]|uniref:hypothetical protein n=1 Tax=Pseudarthrobacter sp. LMD1-1-1.1 TaxID=3135242 RepID=UPI003434E65A